MAIFRLSLKTISRSAGRSSTAAAAYRSGTVIRDARTGRTFDFRAKQRGVLDTALIGWTGERSDLWNQAEQSEKRGNSVVAREVQIALPVELDDEDRWVLALALGEWIHQRYGVAVDVALHDHETNPHAHLLFTTRTVNAAGEFGAKTRLLDERRTGSAEVEMMRQTWERMANIVLAERGVSAQIDHRSYERMGLDRESEHAGRAALAVEAKGRQTENGDRRRRAQRRNRVRDAREAARQMPSPVNRDVARRAVLAEQEVQREQARQAEVAERRQRVQRRMNVLLEKAVNAPQTPEVAPDGSTPHPPAERPSNPLHRG